MQPSTVAIRDGRFTSVRVSAVVAQIVRGHSQGMRALIADLVRTKVRRPMRSIRSSMPS